MKSKSIFVALSALMVLAGCNSGGSTTSTDVQNSNVSNSTANISISAVGCRVITSNGGQCTVTINYSAPNGSAVLNNNTYLSLTGLNNYNNNITSQCSSNSGYFTTSNKTCVVTITSISSTSSSQLAQVYPNGFQNTLTTFTVGGGM